MYRDSFHAIHHDIIDNKQRVTWINGTDDPNNTPRQLRRMTEREYVKRLARGEGIAINFSFKDRVKSILGF